MVFTQKKGFFIRWMALILLIIGLGFSTFYYTAFTIVPNKLAQYSSEFCESQMQDRSYQLKQFILENINNSKFWAQSGRSTFFDSRWFAISFFEYEGQEWVLKDFKINSMALDLYKIIQSDYIKMDQSLMSPHPYSEQMSLHGGRIKDSPILVLEIPNYIEELDSYHMVRISFFSDLFTSILNSNSQCQMNLLDTKGNFLLGNLKGTFSKDDPNSQIKIFKNLFVFRQNTFNANIFKNYFAEIIIVNYLLILAIAVIAVRSLFSRIQARIDHLRNKIIKIRSKEKNIHFQTLARDELTILEEELSHLRDELTRKNLS